MSSRAANLSPFVVELKDVDREFSQDLGLAALPVGCMVCDPHAGRGDVSEPVALELLEHALAIWHVGDDEHLGAAREEHGGQGAQDFGVFGDHAPNVEGDPE